MHGVGARAGGSVGRQYVTAYRTTTLDEASALPPTPPPPPIPLLYVRALSPATSSSGANGSKGSDVWVSGRP
jgi:hypothetical protein